VAPSLKVRHMSTVSENVNSFLKTYILIAMWGLPTRRVTAPTSMTCPVYEEKAGQCKTSCVLVVDQQYALICNAPLFYVLAPTCFGSSLPPSGSIWDPSEVLENQIEWVIYNVWLCDLYGGLSTNWHTGSTTDGTTTNRHIGHITTHYMIYHPFNVIFK
jgi:hypothetical protein